MTGSDRFMVYNIDNIHGKEVPMKKIICTLFVLLTLAFAAHSVSAAGPVNQAGYYKNIRLAGRVRIVDSFPDIKVHVTNGFPDLRVKVVDAFPDDIGEWQFVDYGEDFTVQFVDSFGDIEIQFVDAFPGIA